VYCGYHGAGRLVFVSRAPTFAILSATKRRGSFVLGDVRDLPSGRASRVYMQHKSPQSEARRAAEDGIAKQLTEAVLARFSEIAETAPLALAAWFPGVSAKLCASEASPRFSRADAMALAADCAARANLDGYRLAASGSPDASAMQNGRTFVDVALQANCSAFVVDALHALQAAPGLIGKAEVLAVMVQNSLGKLVREHPAALPFAISLGAKIDPAAADEWRRLHPSLKSRDMEIAFNLGLMSATIDAETAATNGRSPTAVQSAPPRRRTIAGI
jgi:hypothetical protein